MQTVQQLLFRARSMLGMGTVYWAGSGGVDPLAASPADALAVGQKWPTLSASDQAEFLPLAQAAGIDVGDPALVVQACDCSGFVCWALGFARTTANPNGGGSPIWFNTDSIYADAKGAALKFRHIPQPVPGCLVVYPKVGSNERYGHIGIVTEVDPTGKASKVIHCSAVNFSVLPADAIKETGLAKFERQPRTIYVWSRDVHDAATPST